MATNETIPEAIPVVTPSFHLGDDGTLDTVIVCDHCGAELRYTYDRDGVLEAALETETYADFVAWAIDDAADHHVCGDEGSV